MPRCRFDRSRLAFVVPVAVDMADVDGVVDQSDLAILTELPARREVDVLVRTDQRPTYSKGSCQDAVGGRGTISPSYGRCIAIECMGPGLSHAYGREAVVLKRWAGQP